MVLGVQQLSPTCSISIIGSDVFVGVLMIFNISTISKFVNIVPRIGWRKRESVRARHRLALQIHTAGFNDYPLRHCRPVGFLLVEVVNVVIPLPVWSLGPVVLIEARRTFQQFFVRIHNEPLVLGVHFERLPRYSEQLVADTQNAAKRQHRIGNSPRVNVDHDLFELTQTFASTIAHFSTNQRLARQSKRLLSLRLLLVSYVAGRIKSRTVLHGETPSQVKFTDRVSLVN